MKNIPRSRIFIYFLFYLIKINKTIKCDRFSIQCGFNKLDKGDFRTLAYSGNDKIFKFKDLFLCSIFNNDFKNKIELIILQDFDFNGNDTHDFNRFQNVFNLTIRSSKMTRLTLNISKTKINDFIIEHTDLTWLENPELLSPSLISIDLSHNQIEFIQFDFFKNLKFVKNISLCYNHIRIIETLFIYSNQLNKLDISHNLMQKFDRIIFDTNSSFAPKIVSIGNDFTILPEFFASSYLVFVRELEICLSLNERFELESLATQSLNEYFEMKINNHTVKKFYKIQVSKYIFEFLSFAENYQRVIDVLCLLKDSLFNFKIYKIFKINDHFETLDSSLFYQKNKMQVNVYRLISDKKIIFKTVNCSNMKPNEPYYTLATRKSTLSTSFSEKNSYKYFSIAVKNYTKVLSNSTKYKIYFNNFSSNPDSIRKSFARFVIHKHRLIICLYIFSIIMFIIIFLVINKIVSGMNLNAR